MLVALYSVGENCCNMSAQEMAKKHFIKFLTPTDSDSDMKVHAFHYAN